MLQGLAQFCIALLDFLEQADILNGDDGLVGEGLEQRDLLVGEWPNFCSTNCNYADGDPSRSNGVGKQGSIA